MLRSKVEGRLLPLWKKPRGWRIRKACRVGRGSKPKQDQGEYTPSWNLTKGYDFSKKLWEARSKLSLIMNIILSRVQKKWKE